MFTTDTIPNGPPFTLGDLEYEAEWERAAHLLDLDPITVRRLRYAQMECVSRYECCNGEGSSAASLFMATGRLGGEMVATLALGSGVSASGIAAETQELQLQAALMETEYGAGAIGLQLPIPQVEERELWQLARECAPAVARILGDTHFLPSDVASASFAGWMAHTAAQFGAKLKMPAVAPEEYCSRADAVTAESIVKMTALELEGIGKSLREATVSVIGSGPVARHCMQWFQDMGTRVVAVADESGALVDRAGIAIAPLLFHINSGGLLVEYVDAQHALHSDALSVATDVLLLETHGTEITEKNATSVRTSIVVEVSTAGLNCDTARGLCDRGVTVIPSRVTHCLRAIPEMWSSDSRTNREERKLQMRNRLGQLWSDLSVIRKRHQLPLHRASLVLALQRLAERERMAHP